MRQLNNEKYYKRLDFPICADTAYKIYHVLNCMRSNGDISAKQMAYLKAIYYQKSTNRGTLGPNSLCPLAGQSSLIVTQNPPRYAS